MSLFVYAEQNGDRGNTKEFIRAGTVFILGLPVWAQDAIEIQQLFFKNFSLHLSSPRPYSSHSSYFSYLLVVVVVVVVSSSTPSRIGDSSFLHFAGLSFSLNGQKDQCKFRGQSAYAENKFLEMGEQASECFFCTNVYTDIIKMIMHLLEPRQRKKEKLRSREERVGSPMSLSALSMLPSLPHPPSLLGPFLSRVFLCFPSFLVLGFHRCYTASFSLLSSSASTMTTSTSLYMLA